MVPFRLRHKETKEIYIVLDIDTALRPSAPFFLMAPEQGGPMLSISELAVFKLYEYVDLHPVPEVIL
jgi:hypothetical protein